MPEHRLLELDAKTLARTAVSTGFLARTQGYTSDEGVLNVYLTGNTLNNVLTGDAGTNVLEYSLRADTLNGGEGDDIYYVDDINDVVTEVGSGGHDKIYTTIKGFIASNVER